MAGSIINDLVHMVDEELIGSERMTNSERMAWQAYWLRVIAKFIMAEADLRESLVQQRMDQACLDAVRGRLIRVIKIKARAG